MIEAVDFLLYCTGIGVVMVSSGLTWKLASGRSRTDNAPVVSTSKPKWEQVPDPTNDGLVDRLQSFQAARFASPIVHRVIDPDRGPRPTAPALPRKSQGNVVRIPTKPKKEE